MPMKDRTNTIQLLILLVGSLLLAYWGMISLMSGDPWWFLSEFEDQPSYIIVYHDGQLVEY